MATPIKIKAQFRRAKQNKGNNSTDELTQPSIVESRIAIQSISN